MNRHSIVIKADHQLLREVGAEFIGTTFLMAMGIGCSSTYVFTNGKTGSILATLGWALAVTFAVILTGSISGAHLNPAISITFAIFKQLPWYKVPFYILAQVFGACFGSAIAFGIYYDAFNAYDDGIRSVSGANATAGLFATYPQEFLSTTSAFANEVFATFVLLLSVLGVTDQKNFKLPPFLVPLFIGLLIILISSSLCYNSGCAMNPARDLGPRLFTVMAGWGTGVFSYRDYNWFWIPIVGPICGAPLGVFVYKFCFDFKFPNEIDNCVNDKSCELSSINSEEFIDQSIDNSPVLKCHNMCFDKPKCNFI